MVTFKGARYVWLVVLALSACGKQLLAPGKQNLSTAPMSVGSDQDQSEMGLTWEGRRQSDNVIDLRPQPCANPKNCFASFQTGQCTARPALVGSKGMYNSGLCTVDTNGKVTTFCHIEERCCRNSAESPGRAGCDFKPVEPKVPCDKSSCEAGRVVRENKFLCLRSIQTGSCSWYWRDNSWQSICAEVGQLMTKEEGCASLINSPTR